MRIDLRDRTERIIFYSDVYKHVKKDFLFGNDYERFAEKVKERFILSPNQWKDVLDCWNEKEEILNNPV